MAKRHVTNATRRPPDAPRRRPSSRIDAHDSVPTAACRPAMSQTAGLSRLRYSETDSGIGKVMAMRVFVAGGTGVLGRRLVPQLVARGHQVTATTTSAAKLGLLEQLGAEAVVMDGLDAMSVGEAVAAARPDAIVHQMTGTFRGARRQARYEAHRSVVRHHQSAAHRGDGPPAGRGRGDRRIPPSSRRASAASTASARADG